MARVARQTDLSTGSTAQKASISVAGAALVIATHETMSMTNSNAQSNRDPERSQSEIESVVTYLQRTVDELNSVILEHQRRIDSQDKELARLRAMFTNLVDSIVEVPRRPEEEKPPHY
jgi:uncharacterized coiled-coil protein SlyX